MKTHKWALRVIAAVAGFTLVICLTAPAKAAELTEQQIVEYVEQEAGCYALAKMTNDEYQMNRHSFNLKQYKDEHYMTMLYIIGYTDGYLSAASVMSKTPKSTLAKDGYTAICLEES